MTLQEFYDLLRTHDWTYMYSDDSGVNRRGYAAAQKIREAEQAASDPAFTSLREGFQQHWLGDRRPLPLRPA